MSRNVHARALVLIALCVAPAPALAQPAEPRGDRPSTITPDADDTAFDDARIYLDPSGVEWVLDDGVGTDEVPWDDVDREASYLPIGLVHLGAQLRLAALPGGAAPMPDGPLVEVGGFLDVRYGRRSPWRLRVGLALSWQPHSEQYLGAGVIVTSSPLAARLRVSPVAFDIGRWIAVRAGADLGMQWSPRLDGLMASDFFGGATGDVVGLLMDGLLEVGVTGGIQWTAVHRSGRGYELSSLAAEAVVGVTAAYLAP